MLGAGGAHEIGIVIYPGAQLAAVHGLTDLLGIAGRLSADAGGQGAPLLHVSHWKPAGRQMSCVYRSEPSAELRPGTLILPPTLAQLPDAETCEAIFRWLRGQHQQGVRLVTICSGAFLVAGTGLLDGRTVSTHRSCAQALADSFPNVGIDIDQRMIEYPDVLTAGGFMAWVDVALLLIERLLGRDVRAETARFALTGGVGDAAPRSTDIVARREHNDAAIRKAQQFVHLRDGQGVPLAAMAAVAGLERRTFLRRFTSATGTTPIEYCRAVRMARARELLEAGGMPIKTIAEALGYGDVGAFTKAFRRAFGIPPGAHRRLHGGAFEREPGLAESATPLS